MNGQGQSSDAAQAKSQIKETLSLNEGIGHLHGLCLTLRDRLGTLSRHMQNAPGLDSPGAEPASTMPAQLMAAIDAIGEANVLVDGLAVVIGYQV